MRFRELLEYKRDITANNLGTKLKSKLIKDKSFTAILWREYSDIFDDSTMTTELEVLNDENNHAKIVDVALQIIESKDPSANKQYTQWVVMRYIDESIHLFEDILTTFETLLRKYHELKLRRVEIPPQFSDIGQIKNKANVIQFYQNITRIYDEFEEKRGIEKQKLNKGQAKEVFSNAEMRIVVPEDKDAACYYGQGTAWCTASTTSTNYFDHYSKDGPLYILIPKKARHDGEKYQLHFESGQYMDETDSPINLQRLFAERFTDPSTFEFFDEKGNLSAMLPFADEGVLNDIVTAIGEQVRDYVVEEIQEWELSDDYYYTWLRDEGHWNEEEDMPSDDAPGYFDYNSEAEDTLKEIIRIVDISKEDISQWDEFWDDEQEYMLSDLPYVVSSILRGEEERGEGFKGLIADEIETNLSLTIDKSNDSKIPNGWVLHHTWKSIVDGRTKWNKSKVAEKNYVN